MQIQHFLFLLLFHIKRSIGEPQEYFSCEAGTGNITVFFFLLRLYQGDGYCPWHFHLVFNLFTYKAVLISAWLLDEGGNKVMMLHFIILK